MNTITNGDKLTQTIAELEMKAKRQEKDIQESFTAVSDGLKPMNLMKNTAHSIQQGLMVLISKKAGTIREKAAGIIGKLFKKNKPYSNHSLSAITEKKRLQTNDYLD